MKAILRDMAEVTDGIPGICGVRREDSVTASLRGMTEVTDGTCICSVDMQVSE